MVAVFMSGAAWSHIDLFALVNQTILGNIALMIITEPLTQNTAIIPPRRAVNAKASKGGRLEVKALQTSSVKYHRQQHLDLPLPRADPATGITGRGGYTVQAL